MKLGTSFCLALSICLLSITPCSIVSSKAHAQQESGLSKLENICQATPAGSTNSILKKLDQLRAQPQFDDVLLHCIYHCQAEYKRFCLLAWHSPRYYNSVEGRTVPPRLIDFLVESVANCRAGKKDDKIDSFHYAAVDALVKIATTTNEAVSPILPFERSGLYLKVVESIVKRLGAQAEQRDNSQLLFCNEKLLNVVETLTPLPENTLLALSQSENFVHRVAAARSLFKKHWHIEAKRWRGEPLSTLEIETAMRLRTGASKEREYLRFADPYLAEQEAKTLSTEEMFERLNSASTLKSQMLKDYHFQFLPARDDFSELLTRCFADVNRPAFQLCLEELDWQRSVNWREEQADLLIYPLLRMLRKYRFAVEKQIGTAMYNLASAKPLFKPDVKKPINSRSALARRIERALFYPQQTPRLSKEVNPTVVLKHWAAQVSVLGFLRPFDPEEVLKASHSNELYLRTLALGIAFYPIHPDESGEKRLQALRQGRYFIKFQTTFFLLPCWS